jgi:hypothetical protein
MRNFIKFALISIMFMVAISCTCNRQTETPPPTDTSTEVTDSLAPLEYELVSMETFFSPDSTHRFTLLTGCVVYVTHDDNPEVYDYLKMDMLNDNEDYRDVLVRMGFLNDSTEVVGYMRANALAKHKRLR